MFVKIFYFPRENDYFLPCFFFVTSVRQGGYLSNKVPELCLSRGYYLGCFLLVALICRSPFKSERRTLTLCKVIGFLFLFCSGTHPYNAENAGNKMIGNVPSLEPFGGATFRGRLIPHTERWGVLYFGKNSWTSGEKVNFWHPWTITCPSKTSKNAFFLTS